MTKMQAPGARASTGVEEEGLAAFVSGEDLVEVTMAEEEATPEPAVWLMPGSFFETLEQLLVYNTSVPFPTGCQYAVAMAISSRSLLKARVSRHLQMAS